MLWLPSAAQVRRLAAGTRRDFLFGVQSLTAASESWSRRYRFPRFADSDQPLVTIIVVAHNRYASTHRCLWSLARHLPAFIPCEVLVVDDASTDLTAVWLARAEGVRVLGSRREQGLIRSRNRAASAARGSLMCFLGSDAEVHAGWLERLVAALDDPAAGAVGAKIVSPSGRLQEAGMIIRQDGAASGFGRGDSPAEPQYNYLREVDACSGESLLVRKRLFEQVGGFTEDDLAARHVDADLCFSVRQAGFKVLYQPLSQVTSHEAVPDVSGGVGDSATNWETFARRWGSVLGRHADARTEANALAASRRLLPGKTILIADAHLPLYDQDAGSFRISNIIQMLRDLGHSVIFLPADGHLTEPYTSDLRDAGVEVLPGGDDGMRALDRHLPVVDIAWLCRPHVCDRFCDVVRAHPHVRLIYDTVDLHFLRLKRAQELEEGSDVGVWQDVQALELELACLADTTLVVTDVERQILCDMGVRGIRVVPTIHPVHDGTIPGFDEREGLLFIGNYIHPPNVDAVQWLCRHVMPIIWRTRPEIRLTLLGSSPGPEVLALADDLISVPGYLKDVEPYFLRQRVFVAPLRYGAGIKGKVGHSMSYGLPTVLTAIAAEGMHLTPGVDALIADDADCFAAQVLNLYTDTLLWAAMSEASRQCMQRYGYAAVRQEVASLIASLTDVSVP